MTQTTFRNVRFGTVITVMGAIVAYLIGSGFATGQEALQYFSSFGAAGAASGEGGGGCSGGAASGKGENPIRLEGDSEPAPR